MTFLLERAIYSTALIVWYPLAVLNCVEYCMYSCWLVYKMRIPCSHSPCVTELDAVLSLMLDENESLICRLPVFDACYPLPCRLFNSPTSGSPFLH